MIDIYESMEYMNDELEGSYIIERFMGKTSYLKEAEEVLEDIRQELKEDPTTDVTHSIYNDRLCELMKKQFGFGKVYISWWRGGESMVNGFTLCSADVIFRGTSFIENTIHRGYYDKHHKHVCYIAVSSQTFSMLDLTAAEVLGIILHEIGHNFDRSPYMIVNMTIAYVKAFFPIITTMDTNGMMSKQVSFNPISGLTTIGMTTNPGKSIISSIDSFIELIKSKFPILKKIAYFFNKGIDIVSRGVTLIFSPVKLLSLPLHIVLSPISQTLTSLTRETEQFADSFATMYGYGPEMISGLDKISNSNLRVEKQHGKLYSLMTSIAMANAEIIRFCGGDHGTTGTRIESDLEYLKREIVSNEIPREVKKELLKDIHDLEKIKDTYISAKYGENEYKFTGFVRKTISDAFSGRSDYVAKALFGNNFVD